MPAVNSYDSDVFDNNLLYNFLYKIRKRCAVPVVAGMPITNANQVERALKLSGSPYVPQRFKSLVDKFGSDPAAMKQAGIAYATDQIIDLYANNIVHVYSMNKPDVAEKDSAQSVRYSR